MDHKLYSSEQALYLAERRKITREQASTYSSIHLGFVALTAIMTGGINLVLECVLLLIMSNINTRHGSQDFWLKAGLISAGALIRINLSHFALILLILLTIPFDEPGFTAFCLIGGGLGWLGYALYLQFKRVSDFGRIASYEPNFQLDQGLDEVGRAINRPSGTTQTSAPHPLLKKITDRYHQLKRGYITEDEFEAQKSEILIGLETANDINQFCDHVDSLPSRDQIFTADDLALIDSYRTIGRSSPRANGPSVPNSAREDEQGSLHPLLKKISRKHSQYEVHVVSAEDFAEAKAKLLARLQDDQNVALFCEQVDDLPNKAQIFTQDELQLIADCRPTPETELPPNESIEEPETTEDARDKDAPSEEPASVPDEASPDEHPFITKIAKLHNLREAAILSDKEFASTKERLIDELPLDTDFHTLLIQAKAQQEKGVFTENDIAVMKSIYLETVE